MTGRRKPPPGAIPLPPGRVRDPKHPYDGTTLPAPIQPVLEVRVYWEQIRGQLADRFTTDCVIDPKAGSLVRGLAALYAQAAVLEQLAEQNLLGDDLAVAIRKVKS